MTSFAEGIREIQRDVEARHGVPVEVVTVGDCPLDEHLSALLAAAREATVNAAKWSGASVISLFAEVEPDKVEVAVRDRGQRVRPGLGARRSQGRRGVHPRPDAQARRQGDRAVDAGRGDEGDADDGAGPCSGRAARPPTDDGDERGCGGDKSAPRVVLVDDHGLFRSGVRAELGRQVEVVGEADDVAPAIELIGRELPDVVLLDVHLPGGGGHAVITEVKKDAPRGQVPRRCRPPTRPEDVIAVIRAGARGYVTKTISTADLADAIRRVAGGDAVFSHRLAGFVLDAFATAPAAPDVRPSFDPELDQLTTREREVLRLIAQGYTYKEVARELFISVKTVESHVSSVLRKLQLSSRHQLTRWAAERRLT